mmetsp:Transcript_33832/g.93463  ORF Transcript_33832/g.93463 Transcript_33832/m.93463 type:complete len:269 (+) Transcript_33832:264-1070(+)
MVGQAEHARKGRGAWWFGRRIQCHAAWHGEEAAWRPEKAVWRNQSPWGCGERWAERHGYRRWDHLLRAARTCDRRSDFASERGMFALSGGSTSRLAQKAGCLARNVPLVLLGPCVFRHRRRPASRSGQWRGRRQRGVDERVAHHAAQPLVAPKGGWAAQLCCRKRCTQTRRRSAVVAREILRILKGQRLIDAEAIRAAASSDVVGATGGRAHKRYVCERLPDQLGLSSGRVDSEVTRSARPGVLLQIEAGCRRPPSAAAGARPCSRAP